jgi:hypothetical protein
MTTTTAVRTEGWYTERRWLGYAGLIPFVACTAVLVFANDPIWRQIASDTMLNYAAVIASFLGAVHWGFAAGVEDDTTVARLRWGVMPALIAWVLLAVAPDSLAFAGFAVLFGLILSADRYFLPVLDDAYRQLRLQLSSVVVAALATAAIAAHGAS